MYPGGIPAEDIERDAKYLGMTKEQFMDRYLVKGESADVYETKKYALRFP